MVCDRAAMRKRTNQPVSASRCSVLSTANSSHFGSFSEKLGRADRDLHCGLGHARGSKRDLTIWCLMNQSQSFCNCFLTRGKAALDIAYERERKSQSDEQKIIICDPRNCRKWATMNHNRSEHSMSKVAQRHR